MNKGIGYLLVIVGAVIFIGSFKEVASLLKITLNGSMSNIVMIVGLVVLGIGLYFITSGPKRPEEVPIYQGKEIVGYRRLKK